MCVHPWHIAYQAAVIPARRGQAKQKNGKTT